MEAQSKIEETVDSIKDYVNTRYELAVLKASDKVAHIGSNAVSFVPIIFLSVLTAFMLSFALAFYLNTVFVNQYYGFLIVGGIYFVIAFFLICVRKKLIAKPFRNKIIKELFKNNNL
ncbi:MAG: phage holin family protein [Bacteroidetes bacterium]|nr:phage holin family protein [Bacteroidota bacterium]